MDSGDTAFMLIATAMVMLMTPGLALFYSGLVRSKNVLSTTMQSFVCLGVITVIWVLYEYSLAFGPDIGHFVGNLDFAGLKNVGLTPGPYSDTIPDLLFCAFQLMFAIITPALISLDVVGVHGVGGLWGALATGLFFGNPGQLMIHAIGAGAVVVYSVALTFIVLKVIDMTIGLRVDIDDETQGLDITAHGEVGYNI